jgi:hypothetical protein
MSKDRLFRLPVLCSVIFGITLLFGSCLNPIDFSEIEIPTINVNVTIKDVAVMWLINHTKQVDVKNFTISRQILSGEDSNPYPQIYDAPKAGNSLATYHTPTTVFYTISISWENKNNNGETGNWTKQVQFPRAQDYKFHLYRTAEGQTIVIDEDEMKQMPDEADTDPETGTPAIVDAQPFVVINATPNQNVARVEFVKITPGTSTPVAPPVTYAISNEPGAADQQMLYLGTGLYQAKARYTKGGSSYETSPKNITVTQEYGGMAARTNFLYFYKTDGSVGGNGDYYLSQTWPPVPNDASTENRPEDALEDTHGILLIRNMATADNPGKGHSVIQKVRIDTTESYNPDNSPYILANSSHANPPPAGTVKTFILPVGRRYVSFMPTDQTFYGMVMGVDILPKKTTVLDYYNQYADPMAIPSDGGYGAGLIKIINNSTGMALSTEIINKDDLSKSITIGYDGFSPPLPIMYGQEGYIAVVGTNEFPLRANGTALMLIVQVTLQTNDGLVTVQRTAKIDNNILTIEIFENELNANKRIGSKVTVNNQTSEYATRILGLQVYNKNNPASSNLYSLDISSSHSADVYVLSSPNLPIVGGQDYGVKLTVYGNGSVAVIDSAATPAIGLKSDGELYSEDPDKHTRTVTLTDADLPPELKGTFTAITGMTLDAGGSQVLSFTQTDPANGSTTITSAGYLYLNNHVSFTPSDATKTSPITWTKVSGATSAVNLTAGGELTVTGIVASGTTVRVRASIDEAAGSLNNKTTYSQEFDITLNYQNTIKPYAVTSITLTAVEVEVGQTIYLPVATNASFNPPYANKDGVPISSGQLTWAWASNSSYGTLSGTNNATFTAGNTANVTVSVSAVLAGGDNHGGTQRSASVDIRIVPSSSHVAVTGITISDASKTITSYTQTNFDKTSRTLSVGGSVNLNITAVVTPANATKKAPIEWTLSGSTGLVSLNNGVLTVTGFPGNSPYNAPPPDASVYVTPKITGGGSGSGDFTGSSILITLKYSDSPLSRPVAVQNELKVADYTINLGAAKDLRELVTLPAGANINGVAITSSDLTWTITGGAGGGTLSETGNRKFTATAGGPVSIRATLPAAKNGGTQVTADATITVTHPANLTLRFIKVDGSDYISTVALLPTDQTSFPGPSAASRGFTRQTWADGVSPNPTYKSGFKKLYENTNIGYYGIDKIKGSKWEYADLTVPWPSSPNVGYFLFFVEGDSRVRGYTNPGSLDPALKYNFLFYLRFDALTPLWMDGVIEASPESLGALWVVPIGYDSGDNQASIMSSQGVGNRPLHNLNGM